MDLPPSIVEEGVVEEEVDGFGGSEEADHEVGGTVPELVEGPSSGPNEAMVGVVGAAMEDASPANHPRDRATGRAENPGGGEVAEEGCRRGGKHLGEEGEEGGPKDCGGRDRVDRCVLGMARSRVGCSRTAVPDGVWLHIDSSRGYYQFEEVSLAIPGQTSGGQPSRLN